jgi:hypothetical protein
MKDFRDQIVKDALDELIAPYRPEKDPRTRLRRIVVVALLALAAVLGFVGIVHYSAPRGAPATERKPIPVELLPPSKR